MSTLPRQPFEMLPERGAQARYTFIDKRGKERRVMRSGRASFVWLWQVLIPLACGVTESVEIRLYRKNSRWHTVTGGDDAYAQIMAHYRMQTGLKRMVTRRRIARGLTVHNQGGNDA